MKNALLNKRDIWFFAVIAAAAVIIYALTWQGRSGEGERACVFVGGKASGEFDLSVNGEFRLGVNSRIRFEVKNGAVRFKESDCPDKICVKTGYLNRTGQTAVCLPNNTSLVIIGRNETDGFDAAAG